MNKSLAAIAERFRSLPPGKRQHFRKLLERDLGADAAPTLSWLDGLSTESSLEPGSAAQTSPGRLEVFFSGNADRKSDIKTFYNTVSNQLNATAQGEFSFFLNLGYAANGEREFSPITLPDRCLNQNSIKLVLETIGDQAIDGCRTLDVGCGRGGTISVLHTFFRPNHTSGLDLASEAIAFCRRHVNFPNATFVNGDAECLPFDGSVFDVVTNIESSHCYPGIAAFYAGVHRVLKPGGVFLYADMFPTDLIDTGRTMLRECGFKMVHDRDITRNVVLSCDQIGKVRRRAFRDDNVPAIMGDFLGLEGSTTYEELKSGKQIYRIMRLVKSG